MRGDAKRRESRDGLGGEELGGPGFLMERVARVLKLEALTLALSHFGDYTKTGEGTGGVYLFEP